MVKGSKSKIMNPQLMEKVKKIVKRGGLVSDEIVLEKQLRKIEITWMSQRCNTRWFSQNSGPT